MSSTWMTKKFAIIVLALQVIFIGLFGLFSTYGSGSQSKGPLPYQSDLHPGYAMFLDIHLMIFIGFGFLMTFLRRYGYGAIGLNFLLASLAIQWAIILQGLISHGGSFEIGITTLIEGDVAAAAVLITYGALLGKMSPLQLVVVAFLEVIVYAVNFHIGASVLRAVDAGGSVLVHTFGAYFGLACALTSGRQWHREHSLCGAVYHSDLFSLIGTVFLWICWPSFNAALVPGDQSYRAVVNTYLSLAACVLSTFAFSMLVSKRARFDIVHVQNATLAGGVAVGTSADFLINPFGAMIIGVLAGALSVCGYQYLTPLLSEKLGLHDTCGVNNLHGMPGVLGGVAGVLAAAIASTDAYGEGLYRLFPERLAASATNTTATTMESTGGGRSAGEQAAMQAAMLGVTLLLAIIGGLVTGLIARLDVWDTVDETDGYKDDAYWEMPEDEGNAPSPLHHIHVHAQANDYEETR